jgi:hypothetical protein
LADVAREKLKSESPSKFQIPDSYSNDPNDSNSQSSSGVIKLASIKAIIEKNQHCLLDITPNAVDHLNYAQYFPICIYLKAHSRNHTKELRQKYAKNLKAKSSKRLYDNALKLQTFYSHLFTHTIELDTNQWFKKLKEAIDSQQTQPLWISQDLEHLISSPPSDSVMATSSTAILAKSPEPNYFTNHINSTPNGQFNNYHYQREANVCCSTNPNRYLFDDNFEFPIYTAANPAMSMVSSGVGVGAGASTYSLYEENNYRSSFAASDSDIVGIGANCCPINNGLKTATDVDGISPSNMTNYTNENLIYSTNFNNKSMTSKLISNYFLNEHTGGNGHTAVPIILTANDGLNGSSASSSSIVSSASNKNVNYNNNHQNVSNNRVPSDLNTIQNQYHIENYMNSCVNEARQQQQQMDSMNNNYSGISTYMTLNGSGVNSFTSTGYNNYSNCNNSQHLNGTNNFDVRSFYFEQ